MPIEPGDVKITNIMPIMRIGPDGKSMQWYSVLFTVRERVQDQIEIPRDQYSKDRVMQMVLALAQEHVSLLDV